MAETKMRLANWLDDLCVRFILNLPQEELESVERICFQVEEAQWFYEDFVRPLDPSLPSMNLRQFCLRLFRVCPFLSGYTDHEHASAYEQFLAYKTRVPVRGVIMLNESMDEVVLVKGYKRGANWSFPRGKINKDETDLDCAIREAYEETGFNLSDAGLVPHESNIKYVEVTMREQHMKLFVFRNVPQTTHFQPRTRKEISKISWWKLSTLPGYHQKKKKTANDHEDSLSANKLYMVAPFLPPLRKWIAQQRKTDALLQAEASGHAYLSTADGQFTDGDALGEEEVLSDVPHQDQHQAASMGTGTQDGWAQPTAGNLAQAGNAQGEFEAAAHMKQLLGVNAAFAQPPLQQPSQLGSQRPQVQPATLDDHSSNLLATIQGFKPEPPAAPRPPQTPYEQDQAQMQEPPRSPTHHHNQRKAPPGAIQQPPPQFPISPQALPSGSHQQKSSYGGYGPQGMYSIEQVFNTSRGPSISGPLASMQVAAPYQRTGDPSFARSSQPTAQQGLAAPAASQLPTPKLSNHAMNLLSVFKSADKKPTAVSGQPNVAPAKAPAPLAPIGTPPGDQPSRTTKPETPLRSNSLQAFGGLIPTNVAPVSRRESGATPKLAEKPKPASQQDTLLNLFKSGSPAPLAPAQAPTPAPSVQAKPGINQVPAELSAVRSPAPRSQAVLGQTPKAAKVGPAGNEASMTVPKILQRPTSSHKQAKAPSPAPTKPVGADSEMNSSKKKQHTVKQGHRQPKTKSPAITPKQILKRPQEPVEEVKSAEQTMVSQPEVSPPAPAGQTLAPELEPAQNNKPFQPQILRRPQSSSRPSSALEQPAADRAAGATDERKQSLLDLFNAPKKAAAAAGGMPQSTAQAARTAPVSGANSPGPNAPKQQVFLGGLGIAQVDTTDARKSQTGSPHGGAASSGAMSPSTMSSADRGFLLNYLEGVVKGSQR